MAAAIPALGSFGTVLSTIGTVVSVIGAFNQGSSSSRAADYNSQAATNNAAMARSQAAAEAEQAARDARRQQALIRANYGASGVTAEGSVLDVLAESAANAELDRQNIVYRGEVRARGYEGQAQLASMTASSARTGSYWNAGANLLTGAAKTYGTMNPKSSSGGWTSGYDLMD